MLHDTLKWKFIRKLDAEAMRTQSIKMKSDAAFLARLRATKCSKKWPQFRCRKLTPVLGVRNELELENLLFFYWNTPHEPAPDPRFGFISDPRFRGHFFIQFRGFFLISVRRSGCNLESKNKSLLPWRSMKLTAHEATFLPYLRRP